MLTGLTRQWANTRANAGQPSATEAARKALTTLCHAVMNSAAFLYVD
jgi:hypothetical protein